MILSTIKLLLIIITQYDFIHQHIFLPVVRTLACSLTVWRGLARISLFLAGHLIPMKSPHIKPLVVTHLALLDFLEQLILSLDLQINQLIRISEPIHGLIQSCSVLLLQLRQIGSPGRHSIIIIHKSYLPASIEIIFPWVIYLFHVVASILNFSTIIFVLIVF